MFNIYLIKVFDGFHVVWFCVFQVLITIWYNKWYIKNWYFYGRFIWRTTIQICIKHMFEKMKLFQFVSMFMTYVMQQLGICEMIRSYLQRNSSTFFPPKHQFDDFSNLPQQHILLGCKKSCWDVKKIIHNLMGEPSTGAGCFPAICWFWTYFTKSIQIIWSNWFIQSAFNKFELLSYFDVLRLLNFRSHYCLASHHELTQCSNFQGAFSNPWTFHNIAGLRLHDAAGIYKEPWSWIWQRKRGPQHAEVPGHCQWIECWTIMLCPACFSRTTNCSPLFCTLICSPVLQWECVSPMGSSGPFGPPIHVPPRSEATKWRTGNDDNDGGIDLASCRVWWRATNGPSSRHNMSQVSSAFAKTINKKQ